MFNSIDHVAVVTEDIDTGIEFFEDVYGLECWGTNSEEHRQSRGIDAAFFDVGESVLELVSPVDELDVDSLAAKRLNEHGEGFYHIAYAVDDIEEAMARLRAHDIRLLSDEPAQGFSGKIVTCDPEDTILPMQIVEPDGN